MTSSRRRRPQGPARSWPLAAAVAMALLLAAPAGALPSLASGEITGNAVRLEGRANATVTVEALAFGRPDGAGAPALVLTADTLAWSTAEDSGAVAGPNGDVSTVGSTRAAEPYPAPVTEHHATLAFTDAQAAYLVHVFAVGDPLEGAAAFPGATLVTFQHPYMTESQGIDEMQPTDPNPSDMPNARFWPHALGGAMVLLTPDPASSLDLTGDFVLEVIGLQGTLHADSGDHDVRSGDWQTPVAPGVPLAVAHNEDRAFVRIAVHSGSLHVRSAADAPMQWAADGGGFQLSGAAQFHAARGAAVTPSGDQVQVDAASFTVQGPLGLQASPDVAGVHTRLWGIGPDGQPIAPAGQAARLPLDLALPLAAVAAGLAALAILAWAALRRFGPAPRMEDVEAELAAGRYLRAARDAGRILRRSPQLETALISRAIALTKAGRPQRVVREVQAHLARRAPSDGVLHYVLGVAQLDLGARPEAEAAFAQAVRRTPALAADVNSRLPSASSAPNPSPGPLADGHAYA